MKLFCLLENGLSDRHAVKTVVFASVRPIRPMMTGGRVSLIFFVIRLKIEFGKHSVIFSTTNRRQRTDAVRAL
jgi:hypothetical protein